MIALHAPRFGAASGPVGSIEPQPSPDPLPVVAAAARDAACGPQDVEDEADDRSSGGEDLAVALFAAALAVIGGLLIGGAIIATATLGAL